MQANPDEMLPENPDHNMVFNKMVFKEAYRDDALEFLEYFVEMTYFFNLIERWYDEKDQDYMYVFKKRMHQLSGDEPSQSQDSRELMMGRKNQIVNICPYFDLMENSRVKDQSISGAEDSLLNSKLITRSNEE